MDEHRQNLQVTSFIRCWIKCDDKLKTCLFVDGKCDSTVPSEWVPAFSAHPTKLSYSNCSYHTNENYFRKHQATWNIFGYSLQALVGKSAVSPFKNFPLSPHPMCLGRVIFRKPGIKKQLDLCFWPRQAKLCWHHFNHCALCSRGTWPWRFTRRIRAS